MIVVQLLIVLAVLIIAHELGHFLIAKLVGIRVDEFGLGLPPRAIGKKLGETIYSLNWIPFGGFVRIYGEDGTDPSDPDYARAFTSKSRWAQAAAVVAGVVFNVLFAALVLWLGFLWGLPASVESFPDAITGPTRVIVTEVVAGSSAALAGITPGLGIGQLSSGEDRVSVQHPDDVSQFMQSHQGMEVQVYRDKGEGIYTVVPAPLAGIGLDEVGIAKFGFFAAMPQAARATYQLFVGTVSNMYHFFGGLIQGTGDLKDVSGPVGIATIVGSASREGFSSLLYIIAILSLSLAVVNLIPFPALDGGRLAVILIEAIRRKPIKKEIIGWVNTVGFGLLVLLMIAVTYQDIIKLIPG